MPSIPPIDNLPTSPSGSNRDRKTNDTIVLAIKLIATVSAVLLTVAVYQKLKPASQPLYKFSNRDIACLTVLLGVGGILLLLCNKDAPTQCPPPLEAILNRPVERLPKTPLQQNSLQTGVSNLIEWFRPRIPDSFDTFINYEDYNIKSFTPDDIQLIGNLERVVGLRHVSSTSVWNAENNDGMVGGCSLNLSFGSRDDYSYEFPKLYELYGQPPKGRFALLNKRMLRLDAKEATYALEAYQRGIDNFIGGCLTHDLYAKNTLISNGVTTVADLADALTECHFLVVSYPSKVSVRDFRSWGEGLGRFPKLNIAAEHIFQMGRQGRLTNLIPPKARECVLQSEDESVKYTNLMIEQIRTDLIDFLRAHNTAG